MICSQCGQQNPEGRTQCMHCGAALAVKTPPAMGPPAAMPPPVTLVRPGEGRYGPLGQKRYGAGTAVGMGLLLLALMVIPQMIHTMPSMTMGPRGMQTRDHPETRVTWRWSMLTQMRGQSMPGGGSMVAAMWVMALLPVLAGVPAVVGGCLPTPARGVLMILAGILALYGELLILPMMGGGAGGVVPSMPAEAWLTLLALVMLPLVIGGHGAGMRGAGPGPTRFAASIPAMVATLCFGFLMVRAIMASEFKWDAAGGAIFPGLEANQVALVVEIWVAVIAMGGSALVALINVGMARQGVAQAGYLCGMVGVLVLIVAAITGTIMLGTEMSRAQGPMGFMISDGMGGFGIMSHVLIPRLAGIALLLSGYGSVWLGDRRWRWR